eukprot:Colp12_sorted_trinity150504_noHs@6243
MEGSRSSLNMSPRSQRSQRSVSFGGTKPVHISVYGSDNKKANHAKPNNKKQSPPDDVSPRSSLKSALKTRVDSNVAPKLTESTLALLEIPGDNSGFINYQASESRKSDNGLSVDTPMHADALSESGSTLTQSENISRTLAQSDNAIPTLVESEKATPAPSRSEKAPQTLMQSEKAIPAPARSEKALPKSEQTTARTASLPVIKTSTVHHDEDEKEEEVELDRKESTKSLPIPNFERADSGKDLGADLAEKKDSLRVPTPRKNSKRRDSAEDKIELTREDYEKFAKDRKTQTRPSRSLVSDDLVRFTRMQNQVYSMLMSTELYPNVLTDAHLYMWRSV